jgi:hypothetical protein
VQSYCWLLIYIYMYVKCVTKENNQMLFEINVWNYNIILQDFLVQLESKKARVLSINLTSKNFINLRTQEGRELHDRLRLMNRRWEAVCDRANNMQKDLKVSLMQCSEFHHTIHVKSKNKIHKIVPLIFEVLSTELLRLTLYL